MKKQINTTQTNTKLSFLASVILLKLFNRNDQFGNFVQRIIEAYWIKKQ